MRRRVQWPPDRADQRAQVKPPRRPLGPQTPAEKLESWRSTERAWQPGHSRSLSASFILRSISKLLPHSRHRYS